jgi:FSR family fosmidomycin resistance protein-like MFS transporter
LAAAFVVMQRGQLSIEWFAAVALIGMALLWGVGRWYVAVAGAARALARKSRARSAPARRNWSAAG